MAQIGNTDPTSGVADLLKLFTGTNASSTTKTGGGTATIDITDPGSRTTNTSTSSGFNTGSTTQNSGRTDTSQLMITKEGTDAVLRQILESTQGLAYVTSGQTNSGMYNSNVNTLLTNDLLSRTAGEVAKLSAPTVNTVGASSSTQNGWQGPTTTTNVSTVDPRTSQQKTTTTPTETNVHTSSEPLIKPGTALGTLALGVLGNKALGGSDLITSLLGGGGESGSGGGLLGDLLKAVLPGGSSVSQSGNTTDFQNFYMGEGFGDSMAQAFQDYQSTGNTDFFDNLTGTAGDSYDPNIADSIWGADLLADPGFWDWAQSL